MYYYSYDMENVLRIYRRGRLYLEKQCSPDEGNEIIRKIIGVEARLELFFPRTYAPEPE